MREPSAPSPVGIPTDCQRDYHVAPDGEHSHVGMSLTARRQ